MKKSLLYLGFLLFPGIINAQYLNWAIQYSKYNNDFGSVAILKVASAPNGNVVAMGHLRGSIDLDPSSAVADLETGELQYDYFITRNTSDGSFVSAIQLAGTMYSEVALTVDSENNTYALNRFDYTFDFDPSDNVVELNPSATRNVALTRYDGSGNLVWAKQFGSTQGMEPKALTTDPSGNLYVTMVFSSDLVFDAQELYSGLSTTTRSVILKIDPSGNLSWHNAFNENTKVNNLAISPSGKLYTVGTFFGTSDFDLSDSEFPLTASGSFDAFMSVYNVDGSFSSAFRIGKGQSDATNSLAFYPNNDVVMVGQYKTQIDCTPNGIGNGLNTAGGKDGSFIAKYDADFNLLWQRQIGFAAHTFNADVVIDSEGNVCTVGWFTGNANFDPTDTYLNQAIVSAYSDGFISKLNSDGDYVFGGVFTGPHDTEQAVSIAAGENGAIYIGGVFGGSVDVDPSDEEYILSAYGSNGFLIKMDDFAVSVPTISEIGTLNAYPNPSTGNFTIQSSTDFKNQNIFVYNQLGQKVNARIIQSGSEITLQIDGAKGIYFLEIRGETGSRSTAKLIKE